MHNQTEKWIFSSKENFEEVLKYHEGPPCNNCFVLPMCFNPKTDDDDNYVIVSNQPCDEAKKWFIVAEYLDDFIDAFKMLPEGLLTIENIKKIIELGDIIDLEKQIRLTQPVESKVSDFQIFSSSLFELLSITDKDEIIRDFIIPFIEDQSNLFKQREK